ncbi:MAG: DNA-binding protein [Nitrospira bacterium SG8_3]|nr:MAG: DNA-binding protein [Nitrospira bacterium SG8_3]
MKGQAAKRPKSLVSVEQIERAIVLIRGHKVMVDADLAALYGVATKVLNQAVTRNERRFPPDFMFRMTKSEKDELVTNCDRLQRLKHSTTLPRVFTEQGVAMLSSVLNSDRAVQVNIEIMRAFVRLRQMLDAHKDLRRKLAELEKKYDNQFKIVFEAIAELMTPPEKVPRKIGFEVKEKSAVYGKGSNRKRS